MLKHAEQGKHANVVDRSTKGRGACVTLTQGQCARPYPCRSVCLTTHARSGLQRAARAMGSNLGALKRCQRRQRVRFQGCPHDTMGCESGKKFIVNEQLYRRRLILTGSPQVAGGRFIRKKAWKFAGNSVCANHIPPDTPCCYHPSLLRSRWRLHRTPHSQ